MDAHIDDLKNRKFIADAQSIPDVRKQISIITVEGGSLAFKLKLFDDLIPDVKPVDFVALRQVIY